MNRLLAAAAASLLLVLAGCGVDGGEPEQPGPVVGAPTGPGAGTPTGTPAPDDPARSPASSPAAVPDVPVRSAAGLPEVQTQSPPVRVVVPALDADLPVDAVGVAPDGQMEIPEDAARAGWYRFGPSAGAEEGATVIAAHSGSFITAYGPLRDLVELEPGDRIEVTREDGQVLEYAVESARLIPKTTIDLSEHFRRDGEHRLVLITCDGVWQDDVQSYTDNTVVTATLVP
ncbi:class F sortase [Oceanitalea stevensii]|uniref:Sortase n=1 Tax=Oceanitalea stevensii TaxID=2763072 RepID=A0ABR8Z0D8_9MICO|nr:class F sortase [Oceanitalea stevensii]MBD8061797.1 sortase [Oceanitalea stevensii]